MQTSATADDLDGFIRAAKGGGVSDEALVPLLRQNGWSERRVYQTLSNYYATVLGIAPPTRGGRGIDARDAFLYLLNFITLGFWTLALGQLLYMVINRAFPDSATSYYHYNQTLIEMGAWQLAAIIVAFPCFVIVGRLIAAELRQRPESAESDVRNWLTYIALVIAALIVLTDAIWFLEAFLRGSLTIRFVLDSLVLFVLAGGVFTYYLASLRPTNVAQR